jgi:hypothetical protein
VKHDRGFSLNRRRGNEDEAPRQFSEEVDRLFAELGV